VLEVVLGSDSPVTEFDTVPSARRTSTSRTGMPSRSWKVVSVRVTSASKISVNEPQSPCVTWT
jgi:hypothetical protein